MIRRLIPREERFFELFNREANNILEGANVLEHLLKHCEDHTRQARHLKDIEHVGDELTHEVFEALNRTFVTPLEREDISALAAALDDVIDWIEEAARRIHLYHLSECTPLARRFGTIIVEQAQQIATAVPLIPQPRKADALQRAAREIHRLENEADDLLAEALVEVYEGVTQVPQLINAIRWEDIYQILENATDKAEHVAAVLEDIAVKNA